MHVSGFEPGFSETQGCSERQPGVPLVASLIYTCKTYDRNRWNCADG